ncbi:MAG: DNA polymerase III subunit delta [Maricaulaceae bacterium]|nr:DNA polymerase III subunit delta [Maricaulaceae bacterium]
MKVSASAAAARIARPDARISVWLIYGPDRGLVRERAEALAKAFCDDPDDPFTVTRLTEDDLKADPAALADAMAALSLTGGDRLVRLKLSSEGGGAPAAAWLADLDKGQAQAEAKLVIEAGELKPASKLRKAAEASANALALPCYPESGADLAALAERLLTEAGLSLTPGARALLIPMLEGDHALARSELEKLIVYKGINAGGAPAPVEEADVLAICAGSGDAEADAVIESALGGQPDAADVAFARALAAGVNPVTITRALQRRLDQLAEAQAGGGSDAAIARTGAPRYGPPAAAFRKQMGLWRARRLDAARQAAFDLERSLKRSGAPAEALTGDLLLKLARAAARG